MATVTIKSFTDLNTWKEGHKLVLMIYKVTSNFPQKETYSLTDQMRRAASSVTANIAEGFGRQTYKEKAQSEQANISHRLLQGFIQKTKTFINHKS